MSKSPIKKVNELLRREYAPEGFAPFLDVFAKIENDGSPPTSKPFDLRKFLDDIPASVQNVLSTLEVVVPLVVPIAVTPLPDLTTAAQALNDGLVAGTDPNSTNSPNNPVNAFRQAVDAATSPAYAGDALNDNLADLLAFISETNPPS